MRRLLPALRAFAALAPFATLVALAGGCGSKFDLPTEHRANRRITPDQSYTFAAKWTGMARVRDVLLTQRSNSQGACRAYPLTRSTPIRGTDFLDLGNPIALGAGGDGTGSPLNRVYVLDKGDTCIARRNPFTQVCGDTVGGWLLKVGDVKHYWHVREYGLLGGAPITTFTDTLVADVEGIAADNLGNVYVSGTAIIEVADVNNPRILTRIFQSRIYRYARGPLHPGVPDSRVPGANWHRDDGWEVIEGSGIGSVTRPKGIDWMDTSTGPAVFAADSGNKWIQRLSASQSSTGAYRLDGAETGTFFFGLGDVAADASGFVYVCDTGNQRVLRYDGSGQFVQRVDLPEVVGLGPLMNPIAVASNDTLVYIADPAQSTVFKMRRTP